MPTFPLLAHPESYRACRLDLGRADQQRAYWLNLFRSHIPTLLEEALREYTHAQCESADAEFTAYLDTVTATPEAFGRLDILQICYARDRALHNAGIHDAYRLAKLKAEEDALMVFAEVLDELDSLEPEPAMIAAIEGVFAGNIFDRGATKTNAMFANGSVDFHDTRDGLKPRPWLIDDLNAWLGHLRHVDHRAACLFVDNAGPDILLGMIPFGRELLKRGATVILTANTAPSLNDITHAELVGLLAHPAAQDPLLQDALRDGRLQLIPSGNDAPLFDLHRCSEELCEAVTREGVDLVMLEGMGRALESNFDADFQCDCLKLAMIKDLGVAAELGAELFDLVMKFEPVAITATDPRLSQQ